MSLAVILFTLVSGVVLSLNQEEINQPLDYERPVMFVKEDKDSIEFNYERWDMHGSSGRYFRLLASTFLGVTTRRILPPTLFLMGASAATSLYLKFAYENPDSGYLLFQIPLFPFELAAPILSLLLVFRSDNAYGRFKDGSIYSWEITTSIRSYVRRLVVWTGSGRSTAAERAASEEIVLACCLLHQWIMNEYLRNVGPTHQEVHGRQVYESLLCAALGVEPAPAASTPETKRDVEMAAWLGNIDTTLNTERGVSAVDMAGILGTGAPPTPYLGLEAIALGATKRLPSLTDQERVGLEDELGDVASNLGQCERILRQPIPLGYKRYTIRFLWLWLLGLPFALVPKFSEFGMGSELWPGLTVGTITFLSLVLLSVEDISVQIEQPFNSLPLELTHNWLLRDVGQSRRLLQWSAYERGDFDPSASIDSGPISEVGQMFRRLDKNGDGVITAQEWIDAQKG